MMRFKGIKYEETTWGKIDSYMESIREEIRKDNGDMIAVDFLLYKIERRIKHLEKHFEKRPTNTHEI